MFNLINTEDGKEYTFTFSEVIIVIKVPNKKSKILNFRKKSLAFKSQSSADSYEHENSKLPDYGGL